MPVFATNATPSWYALCTARSVRPGRAKAVSVGERRLVAWRGHDGAARVADAACPHLGADLATARVEAGVLVCPFHGWRIDGEGRCDRSDRRARVYPVIERFGLLWAWIGGEVRFDLPSAPEGFRSLLLPSRRVAAHPHLVVGNGLDAAHYATVHGFAFDEPPSFDRPDPWSCALRFTGRLRSPYLRFMSGTRTRSLRAEFRTLGGNLALATVDAPLRFQVLFSGRPEGSGCVSHACFLVPRGTVGLLRALAVMVPLVRSDRRVLEGVRFNAAFTAQDEPMARFAEVVERLGPID